MPPGIQPERRADCGRPDPARRAPEAILLVDDVEPVRRVVKEMLALNGYAVLEAGSAAEGLELAARHQGTIDLLLTDVVMPHMSGVELAERIRACHPDLKMLFMSGYTEGPMARQGLGSGPAFIGKPFTADALAAKIRVTLTPPASRRAPDLP